MNNIIASIKSKLDNPIKYRVVFDVDDVLCCSPMSLDFDLKHDKESFFKKKVEQYPGSVTIYWTHKDSTYVHFFYPNLDRLLLSILSWDNWSVDFFSSGVKERNEEVIPNLLKQILSKYSNDFNNVYKTIIDSGRLRIFSRDHMVKGNSEISGYETFGQHKKDLTIVSDDIANTILIDDDRTYVVGSQYPFICTSYSASSEFKNHLCYKETEFSRTLFDPSRNAEYILGILLSCKEKLDNKEALSLRESLDISLRHNGETLESPERRESTPWFLHPTTELDRYWNNGSPENTAFFRLMKKWIEEGEKYWLNNFISIP